MLRDATPATFVATLDAARARAFYEETLGLRFVVDDGFALVFELGGGVPLRVSRVQAHTPFPFTVLGWVVPDLAAAVDALAAKGVAFERYPYFAQDERGIWHAPGGTGVAWMKDPDGNVLSLTQAP